jgi:hypothetical protein
MSLLDGFRLKMELKIHGHTCPSQEAQTASGPYLSWDDRHGTCDVGAACYRQETRQQALTRSAPIPFLSWLIRSLNPTQSLPTPRTGDKDFAGPAVGEFRPNAARP